MHHIHYKVNWRGYNEFFLMQINVFVDTVKTVLMMQNTAEEKVEP